MIARIATAGVVFFALVLGVVLYQRERAPAYEAGGRDDGCESIWTGDLHPLDPDELASLRWIIAENPSFTYDRAVAEEWDEFGAMAGPLFPEPWETFFAERKPYLVSGRASDGTDPALFIIGSDVVYGLRRASSRSLLVAVNLSAQEADRRRSPAAEFALAVRDDGSLQPLGFCSRLMDLGPVGQVLAGMKFTSSVANFAEMFSARAKALAAES